MGPFQLPHEVVATLGLLYQTGDKETKSSPQQYRHHFFGLFNIKVKVVFRGLYHQMLDLLFIVLWTILFFVLDIWTVNVTPSAYSGG